MSFLSTDALKEILPTIVGTESQPVDGVAIVLTVGREVFITGHPTKDKLKEREQFEIPSGQFALLITDETISLPLNKLGFITIKFGLKKQGLVNISGFHVDPGFSGKLLFSVYNAGASDIVLSQGADAFRLWIEDLKIDAEPYNGKHQGQIEISDDDVKQIKGRIASPAALMKRINRLYDFFWIGGTVLMILAVPLFVDYWWPSVKGWFRSEQPKTIVIRDPGSSITIIGQSSVEVLTPDSVVIWYKSSSPEKETTGNWADPNDTTETTITENTAGN